jgi:FlaA1/EpsC-like NDP-sugar epimerase
MPISVKKKIENQSESSPSPWRSVLLTKQVQYAMDLTVLVIAFVLSYLLRFDFDVPPDYISRALLQMPLVVLVQFTALLMVGVYAFIWRYIGLTEVRVFLKAALWSAVPLVALRLLPADILQQWRAPLSVILFDTILAFGGVLALRVLRRDLYERSEKRRGSKIERKGERKSVLLIGAGRSGVMTVKEILGRGDAEIVVKGFIDDDPLKQRAAIHGIKVLGTMRDLPRLVRELEIDHVVISITQTSRQDFRRMLEICEQIPVKVRQFPVFTKYCKAKWRSAAYAIYKSRIYSGVNPCNLISKICDDT